MDILNKLHLSHIHNNKIILEIYIYHVNVMIILSKNWHIVGILQIANTYCKMIRQYLVEHFCKTHLSGLNNCSILLNRNTNDTKLFRALTGDCLVIVCIRWNIFFYPRKYRFWILTNVTLRTQTSKSDQIYDRWIYSKSMRPYPGQKWQQYELLETNDWNQFEPGDAFLIDHGFQDFLNHISRKSFVDKLSSFLKKTEKHY